MAAGEKVSRGIKIQATYLMKVHRPRGKIFGTLLKKLRMKILPRFETFDDGKLSELRRSFKRNFFEMPQKIV